MAGEDLAKEQQKALIEAMKIEGVYGLPRAYCMNGIMAKLFKDEKYIADVGKHCVGLLNLSFGDGLPENDPATPQKKTFNPADSYLMYQPHALIAIDEGVFTEDEFVSTNDELKLEAGPKYNEAINGLATGIGRVLSTISKHPDKEIMELPIQGVYPDFYGDKAKETLGRANAPDPEDGVFTVTPAYALDAAFMKAAITGKPEKVSSSYTDEEIEAITSNCARNVEKLGVCKDMGNIHASVWLGIREPVKGFETVASRAEEGEPSVQFANDNKAIKKAGMVRD